jgi:hypothetical protein
MPPQTVRRVLTLFAVALFSGQDLPEERKADSSLTTPKQKSTLGAPFAQNDIPIWVRTLGSGHSCGR